MLSCPSVFFLFFIFYTFQPLTYCISQVASSLVLVYAAVLSSFAFSVSSCSTYLPTGLNVSERRLTMLQIYLG